MPSQLSIHASRLRSAARPQTALLLAVTLVLAFLASITLAAPASAASGSSCGANVNPVTCENSQTAGVTDSSVWDINGAGDDTIQGFSTDISVNNGGSIGFKIDTSLSAYTIDVYRLGYYGGAGARLWAGNLAHATPKKQPACLTDPSTLLYDCGNWSLSATWNVPSNAVSGVYIARLTGSNGDASQISFIVRNDSSTSDVVYQTSDPTWEAYNLYGGSDFYQGTNQLTNSQARAFKVSYNRPFATRGSTSGRDFLFSNEYPTIRFLERNGYDVSYISGVDTDRYGATLLKNHKVFMSVGHDEYWSQAQRTNVENARDAGVNLMFLSGNEVYWHTRYEPSIDGTNTAYRTLVCYKETWDDSPTDPTGESTATWRDPRFGTAPGGANPENALTGTMFMANSDDLALQVSGAQGKLRLWRGTTLGSVPATTVTTLAPHTVGYESDEDVDNGFRPAGLIDLSTTVGSTPQYLTDFGSTVVPGTTTHHLTEYRAASGALVFGAGTIQWGWGLDQYHDGDNSAPADSRIQQATVNLLADMKAQPTTLMSGLVAASASTDTTPPTPVITSPAAGSTIANGTTVTVTGTATDAGGGIVAGVEVSVDGGTTWHPATGTTSWSYTGVLKGNGTSSIKVRATDDSVNTSAVVTDSVTTNCPCSLFGSAVPKTVDGGDASSVELGVRFSATTDGYVSGIRFYKATANTGSHIGTLWTASGTQLATGTFTNETASGWQTLQFASPVAVTANTTYVASYYAPSGHYSADASFFYFKDYTAPPLVAGQTLPNGSSINGVYADGHGFPSSTYKAGNYYVDVTFSTSDSVPPSVTAVSPSSGAGSIATNTTITATFSKPMNSSTIAFAVTDPNNTGVAGSVTYDSTSKTATFTPSAALAAGTLYTVAVTGKDTNGNSISPATNWNFRTAYAGQVGGGCPCSLFSDSTTPSTVTVNDPASVELGIKFTPAVDGIITGIRFYKGPQNTGTHTGTLWKTDGTQLATATFTGESTSGWQTVNFTSPVAVSAGTTYVASYHTSVGFYSATSNAYASSGINKFPLSTPNNAGTYTYAAGYPSNSSDADYGVDVVFTVPSSLVPTVATTSPNSGDTGVGTGSTVTVGFNTAVIPGTPVVSLSSAGGAVAGTASLDSGQQTLTFTPTAPLTAGAQYTVTVNGARTLAGTPMAAPVSYTFTTGGGSSCPCTLFASNDKPATADSGDGSAVALGVKIIPATSGYITGVRFYKASTNTGTHTGSVWSSSGTRLGTVTFANETASGWQTATFSQPVAVSAGSTYVVSYYAPNGHYSATSQYFATSKTVGPLTAPGPNNGVYHYGNDAFLTDTYGNTNYWVDAVFSTTVGTDTTPPTVTGTSPIDGETSVLTGSVVTATFSEPMTAASVVMTLKDASGNPVGGITTFDPISKTATFTPSAALSRGVKYTATATGSDASGNAMAAPQTWSFTTAQPSPAAGVCPCSLWDDSARPETISDSDTRAIEVGLAFTSDTSGQITGARFYKGPSNTGTHTASLWSSTGTLLATGTFAAESSAGWQSMTFPAAVNITANTTYVISYHTNAGSISYTDSQFGNVGRDNPPLHVGVGAARYAYGTGGFPTTASNTNYWVDPVFNTGVAADTTPPVISGAAATPSGSTAAISWTTDEASSSRVDYGTSATALTSSATGAGGVIAHSVTLPGLASATTYYYKVTSADVSGNSATSATALSFTSADTTPPVISAVTATPASTTATIAWTTNEASTSRVDYGTSATNLNLNTTVAGSVTTHSVPLTGLAAGTRYYYRVTSVDPSGNSATSPVTTAAAASFGTSYTDATVADFKAGTFANTYAGSNGDGEVVLTPLATAEFTGTTLPSGWTSTSGTGGSTTVANGTATVKNATLTTSATNASGASIETLATLLPNQSIGWVTSSNSATKIQLSVTGTNLIATVNDGFFGTTTATAMTNYSGAHKLRIEWASTSVSFYVDDALKYTKSFNTFYSNMRPSFADTVADTSNLVINWVRVGPYAATGSYVSRVMDAGISATWGAVSWDATVPTGSTLVVQVRSGTSPNPDGTWSAWATIPTSGTKANKTGRYLQYQLVMTATGTRLVTAQVRSVQVAVAA